MLQMIDIDFIVVGVVGRKLMKLIQLNVLNGTDFIILIELN